MPAEPQRSQELGDLKIMLFRARNLKGPELIGKKDCYIVFTIGEKKVGESSVKHGTVAPVWDEEFEIKNVLYPPPEKLVIRVFYKGNEEDDEDEMLGFTAPWVDKWTKGAQTPKPKWMVICASDTIIATKGDHYAGEVQFQIHWTKHESPKLEPPKLESPKLKPPYSQVFKSIDPVLLGVHAGLLL